MVFVLTTQGYINTLNPALKLYKYKAINGFIDTKPHISIDLEKCKKAFTITFLNGIDITLSDDILVMDSENNYIEIDKLKFGTKLAFIRTPDCLVENLIKKPEYIELINDLADMIISKGKMRKVGYDGMYCDIVVDWSKEILEEYLFGLSSIGIYLKVRVNSANLDKNMITVDSNTLNYIDNLMQKSNLINAKKIKMLNKMKAIGIVNIDKERECDNYKIVKNVSLLNKENKILFLKSKSGLNNWDYLVLSGIQCKFRDNINLNNDTLFLNKDSHRDNERKV
jgi:hypothetical protein